MPGYHVTYKPTTKQVCRKSIKKVCQGDISQKSSEVLKSVIQSLSICMFASDELTPGKGFDQNSNNRKREPEGTEIKRN